MRKAKAYRTHFAGCDHDQFIYLKFINCTEDEGKC